MLHTIVRIEQMQHMQRYTQPIAEGFSPFGLECYRGKYYINLEMTRSEAVVHDIMAMEQEAKKDLVEDDATVMSSIRCSNSSTSKCLLRLYLGTKKQVDEMDIRHVESIGHMKGKHFRFNILVNKTWVRQGQYGVNLTSTMLHSMDV